MIKLITSLLFAIIFSIPVQAQSYCKRIKEHRKEYKANFDKDESRHIVRVLRKKSGDIVHITNGKGWLFTSELISVEQKYCSAKIISKQEFKKRNYKLHLPYSIQLAL